MATLNLICAEKDFLKLIENEQLNILQAVSETNMLKISKVHTLKSIYSLQRKQNKPFELMNLIFRFFKGKQQLSPLKKVESYIDNQDVESEIILFVNPSHTLSKITVLHTIERLKHDSRQIIIDNNEHRLDCNGCSEKAYWSFTHWMETLQSSTVIGEESSVISFIAMKRSLLNELVDFQFDSESITYRKVI
jgi:hypothetical protein